MHLGKYSQLSLASECALIFNCSVSVIVYKRKAKFLSKLKYSSDNMMF